MARCFALSHLLHAEHRQHAPNQASTGEASDQRTESWDPFIEPSPIHVVIKSPLCFFSRAFRQASFAVVNRKLLRRYIRTLDRLGRAKRTWLRSEDLWSEGCPAQKGPLHLALCSAETRSARAQSTTS